LHRVGTAKLELVSDTFVTQAAASRTRPVSDTRSHRDDATQSAKVSDTFARCATRTKLEPVSDTEAGNDVV